MTDYNTMIRAIKQDPHDKLAWYALADLLEERNDNRHSSARMVGDALGGKGKYQSWTQRQDLFDYLSDLMKTEKPLTLIHQYVVSPLRGYSNDIEKKAFRISLIIG